MKDKSKTEPLKVSNIDDINIKETSSCGKKVSELFKKIKSRPMIFGVFIGVVILLIITIIIIIIEINKVRTRQEKIDKILSSLPPRASMSYEEFHSKMKKKAIDYELNEDEKAWLAYSWIGHNIVYRHDSSVKAENAYINGYTTCTGYAQLFSAILQNLGFPEENTAVVSGYTQYVHFCNPDEFEANHRWSAAKIDGKWCLFDVRQGTGNGADDTFEWDFKEFFYCTPPEWFIRSHLTEEKHEKYQFLDRPYTPEKFCKVTPTHYLFYKYGFREIDPDYAYINSRKGKIKYYYNGNPNITLNAILRLDGVKQKGLVNLTKYDNYFELLYNITNPGTYILSLCGNDVKNSTSCKTIASHTFIIENK